MLTEIDEKISVNLLNNRPTMFIWNGRTYTITKIGLHHMFWQGRTLIHVFSVTDENTFFRLQLDTQTLSWRLTNVQPG